jgi:hypothetical protein
MQNKTNRWLDVQIVIASLAMTFSLALWNLFSGGNQGVSSTSSFSGSKTSTSPSASSYPSSTAAQPVTSAPQASVPQGRIYLGGTAPGSSLSGTSSGNANVPAPVTSTGSSRP